MKFRGRKNAFIKKALRFMANQARVKPLVYRSSLETQDPAEDRYKLLENGGGRSCPTQTAEILLAKYPLLDTSL